MQLPLQVTFRNMDSSPAIEKEVREKAAKLEKFCDRITSCRVIVEAPHRHQHQGKLYHVRVDLSVPGEELVVSREPENNRAHEDVYVAIRDAFDAARRQLQDYSRRQRGKVKQHEVPPQGRIAALFRDEGYGNIETADGRSIYFHRNSVVNADFDKLQLGTPVRFAEEAGDRGPQASTVHVEA